MTPDDTTTDASTLSPRTRRAFLGATGTATLAALAGCDENIAGNPTPDGPTPEVTLENVRVVQTVENSALTTGGGRLSDPPLVAGEYVTVMFDVSISHPDNLPETVGLLVSSTPDTPELPATVSLHRDDLKAINNGADAPAVFHARTSISGDGAAPPVFTPDAGTSEVTVKLLHAGIDGDSVTLTEGPNDDFEIGTLDTLRVGFIPIQHRGATDGSLSIDWGDANGGVNHYQRSVASSFEVLRRAFPGQVVGYRHDRPFVARDRTTTNNAATRDAEDALQCLNQVIGWSSFPNGGTILTEDIPRSDAVAMMDATQGGALDGHVVIVPKAAASTNGGYFPAHWSSSPPAGYHYHFNAAVMANEAGTRGDDVWHTHITAQELGHRFAQPVYSGAFRRAGSDRLHAAGDLESTCYDLTDGTYSLVNDWSVADGAFSNGGAGGGSAPTVNSHVSYMSYAGGDHWADSRIQQYFIEGDWATGYSGGSAPAPHEPQRVLAVFGRRREGGLVFEDAATYIGRPGPTTYDPDRDHDATPVDIRLEGPTGEPLATQTVPDRYHGHDGPVNAVSATLAFPTQAVRLVGTREGAVAELNAIVAPLRNEVREMPTRAFRGEEATRERLLELLEEVDALMANREYGAAATRLEEQFLARVDQGVRAYDNFANEFTADQLAALTQRHAERLATIAG